MADYKTVPLKVCAFVTGGVTMVVNATLKVDGKTSPSGQAELADVHVSQQCAQLRAQKKTGVATLRLAFSAAPFVGNGEFEVTFRLEHPALPEDPLEFVRVGKVEGGPDNFIETIELL